MCRAYRYIKCKSEVKGSLYYPNSKLNPSFLIYREFMICTYIIHNVTILIEMYRALN